MLANRVADDDPRPILLVERFEPCAEVHSVAYDRVAHDGLRSDVAGNHGPGADSDTDVQLRPAFRLPMRVERTECVNHVERSVDGMLGMLRIVERRAEETHDHVADELI